MSWKVMEPGAAGVWLITTDRPFRHPIRGHITNVVAWVNRREDAELIVKLHNEREGVVRVDEA